MLSVWCFVVLMLFGENGAGMPRWWGGGGGGGGGGAANKKHHDTNRCQ